jgi:AcrR family transcriptional regulator
MNRPKAAKRQVRLPGRERKRIILEKAVALFASRGFHGVSIDQIAAGAGITKPVLYDHFSSKQSLYIGVSKAIRDRLLAAGSDVVMLPRSFPDRVWAGIEAFFVFAEKNPAAIRILLSPPRDEKKLYRAIQALQDEATTAIMKMMLAAGVQRPETELRTTELKIQAEFVKRGASCIGRMADPTCRGSTRCRHRCRHEADLLWLGF